MTSINPLTHDAMYIERIIVYNSAVNNIIIVRRLTMKLSRSTFGVLSGALALIFLTAPLQADVKIKSRMVDCEKGQDPAKVLNQEQGPQRLEITLVGTCPGFTVIRDDVMVKGDDEYGCPATTTSVNGTIKFEGHNGLLLLAFS